MITSVLARRILPALAGVLFWLAAPASAQVATTTPDEFAARQISRLALMNLRLVSDPGPEDYRLASLLLGLALESSPKDPELIRHAITAAYSAGDPQTVLELTRRLVALDPTDTVAQLRLISALINAHQDADARLAAYDRFLGPAGRSLDPAIRSRLALDQALLRREGGDTEGFASAVALATQIDPTNKEAAALAAGFYADRVGEPVGQLEMTLNVLNADPLDPNIHLGLCRQFASQGVWDQAIRFHENAFVLLQAAGMTDVEDLQVQQAVLQWMRSGPEAVVRRFNDELLAARESIAMKAKKPQPAALDGSPAPPLPSPADVRLKLAFDELRLVAAEAAGDRATVEQAMDDLRKSAEEDLARLADPTRRGTITDAEALRLTFSIAINVQRMRMWLGVELEQAQAEIAATDPRAEQLAPQALAALKAWTRFRGGDSAGALADFQALENPDLYTLFGIAACHEAVGQSAEAVAIYQDVAARDPLSFTSAWAASRLKRLGAEPRWDANTRRELARLGASVPRTIDAIARTPDTFISFKVEPLATEIEAIDRPRLRITLRNNSDFALGVGTSRPINSRVLLSPTIFVGLEELREGVSPEVIDADRRLRLRPGESYEAIVYPDSGFTGWLAESRSEGAARMSWRAVQGFRLDKDNVMRPGPGCVALNSAPIKRRRLLEAQLTPAELAVRVRTDTEEALPGTVLSCRVLLVGRKPPEDPAITDQDWSELPRALADRYPNLSPRGRRLLASTVPGLNLAPLIGPYDEVVRRETDTTILAAILLQHSAAPDDPTLVASLASDDPRLREIAELLAARLQAGTPLMSTIKTGSASPGAPGASTPGPGPRP